MPLRTVVPTNESNFCSDENGIEENSVPLHGLQESKVNLKYLAQVQEMESLCRSKDRKIDALSASYADSLHEICRLKSQLESITLSNGATKDSDRKETEGTGKKKKSSHHQEDKQSELQELHQKIEEDISAKKQELKKLLECIQRKEKVAQVKRGELIKVMRLKNISLLHLEDEITRAKKTRSLLQEQLAQRELKLKSQQQQIEHQERLISMQHDGQSVNGEGELLETKVSRRLPESKECDVKDDGHGQAINERAMKLCSSFSSSYSDMTARIRVLAQQLRKLQRLLDVSLIEKEQVTSHLARIREKCRKQAKIIYDLKGERDQLLSRSSNSRKSTRAPLTSKSSSDCIPEATTASNQSLVDLTQLEKKHAEIIQKNNWNKELKDFMREVMEYARKKEEVHQIKRVTQVAQAVKDYSTCRSDSIKMSSLSECSELTTSELVDELHLKERTILNLMEQLKLCQEKYSHIMEENQKITLEMECHQTREQKKIMELEMRPSHLAQPESDVAAEKDALLSRHEKLMKDHELTDAKIEDLTQKLAVSEKDKTIMEGILQELSKELVCVEQDKAEMQSALEDLRRRQEEYSCEEPLVSVCRFSVVRMCGCLELDPLVLSRKKNIGFLVER